MKSDESREVQEATGKTPVTSPDGHPASVYHSFDSVCGECGALIPAGGEACLVCGAHRDQTEYQGVFPVPAERAASAPYAPGGDPRAPVHRAPEQWRRLGRFLSVALVLALVCIAGFSVYRQYFDTSSYRAHEAILFENSAGRYMISFPDVEYAREITGIDRPQAGGFAKDGLQASPNGRWIAYTDSSGTLYLMDLAQNNGMENTSIEAVRLAGSVQGPAVFSDDNDYLVYLNMQKELYACDMGGNRWTLDTDVVKMVAVDGRRVLYTRRGDRDRVDLYIDSIPKDSGEWLLIGRGVTEVLDWTPGFERLLYTGLRQNEETGLESNSLQMFEIVGNTTTTLAMGIGDVLDASAEKGSVIFAVSEQMQWSYDYFINDDLAEQDRDTVEPDIADYPLVERATRLYGQNADFTDLSNDEELIIQNREYQDALREWEEKQVRDELREQLREALDGQDAPHLYNLYAYRNGELAMLDSGVWPEDSLTPEEGHVSAANGFIAYRKIYPDSIRRLQLSDGGQNGEIKSYVEYFLQNVDQELIYSSLSGTQSRLYTRSESFGIRQWRVSSSGAGVYFTIGPHMRGGEDGASLYYAQVHNETAAAAILVKQNVSGIEWALQNGVIFTSSGGNGPQLMLAQEENVTLLSDSGAVTFPPVSDGTTLLYLDAFDDVENTGSLYLYNKAPRFIADKVHWFEYHSDSLIYYLKPGEGDDMQDVYCWVDGQQILVEQDVTGVIGLPGNF